MKLLLGVILAILLPALSACNGNDNNNAATAEISSPPDAGAPNLLAQTFDLGLAGYELDEYFISGKARAYSNTNEFNSEGTWEVTASDEAAYTTRIVVHRPLNPDNFSGTVIVEWLNVTSGFDIPPSWGNGHVEIYRSGHIWIGISAQQVGIDGSERALLPLHLKASNPERYGELLHPGDSFSYSIFSQLATTLRNPGTIDPLQGMTADYLLAMGQSQSASRLTTYVNAIQPLHKAYDGFILHSRGGGSAPLAQQPLPPISTPQASKVRPDINVPVMTFQTETDVTGLAYAAARQEDSNNFILWEVTGTAHNDYYAYISGRSDFNGGAEFATVAEANGLFGFISCDLPMNAGPSHYVFHSAIRHMDRWIRTGTRPPTAARLTLLDPQSYQRDAQGNALGGIRTPFVDAPSATLTGEANTGDRFCNLFGTTRLFSASEMATLYGDQAGFESAVTSTTQSAVDAGFILPEDAIDIIDWAPEQWLLQQ